MFISKVVVSITLRTFVPLTAGSDLLAELLLALGAIRTG